MTYICFEHTISLLRCNRKSVAIWVSAMLPCHTRVCTQPSRGAHTWVGTAIEGCTYSPTAKAMMLACLHVRPGRCVYIYVCMSQQPARPSQRLNMLQGKAAALGTDLVACDFLPAPVQSMLPAKLWWLSTCRLDLSLARHQSGAQASAAGTDCF